MESICGESIVDAYVCIIKSMIECCKDKASHNATSRFHAVKIPSISIEDYVKRITKYFQCSYECFVCSLSYIDMLLADHFVLNAFSVHRTILVSVMEAAKFYDDCFFNNEFYARVGGVPVEELNALEMDFLFAIHFSLIVPLDAYQELHNELFLHCSCICENCHGLHIPHLDIVQKTPTYSYLCYSSTTFSDSR
ncbi:hypothetical protein WA577_004025 [Blastocystis sp. JDR]